MSARIRAPVNLCELVRTAFASARESGHVLYFPTQVTILPVNTIPFQLRFSPSLANKPQASPKLDEEKERGEAKAKPKAFDPFDNPPRELFICPLGPSHFLVLNKFAVVPEHFILATNEYKLQSHVLEESDLEATLTCVDAYERRRDSSSHDNHGDDSHGLFAFFNGGAHSGASQPHRHIQLLPISRMKDGLDSSIPWTVLASDLHALSKAPFLVFAESLNRDSSAFSPAHLHAIYLRLYRQACRAVAQHTQDQTRLHDGEVVGQEAKISYNLALTSSTMALCPRLSDGATVTSSAGGGDPIGSLSLNGTLLAGTALVKNELEWDALRRNHPQAFTSILRTVGVPRADDHESSLKL